MRYAVIKKVTERTGPNQTTFASKQVAPGQVVDIAEIVELQNETWGRVSHRERAWMCINTGDDTFLAPLEQLPDPDLFKKLIAWARTQGFKPNA